MEDMKSISKIKVSHISLTPNQKHSFLKTVEPVQSTRAPLAGSRSGLSCKSVFVDPDLHLWGSDRVLQISCCTILTRVYQVVYFRYGSRVEFIHPLLSLEEWRESSKSHLGIKLFRFCASIKYCTDLCVTIGRVSSCSSPGGPDILTLNARFLLETFH